MHPAPVQAPSLQPAQGLERPRPSLLKKPLEGAGYYAPPSNPSGYPPRMR